MALWRDCGLYFPVSGGRGIGHAAHLCFVGVVHGRGGGCVFRVERRARPVTMAAKPSEQSDIDSVSLSRARLIFATNHKHPRARWVFCSTMIACTVGRAVYSGNRVGGTGTCPPSGGVYFADLYQIRGLFIKNGRPVDGDGL